MRSRSCVRMLTIFCGPVVSPVLIPSDSMAMAASFCSAVRSCAVMPSCASAFDAIFGGPARRKKPERSAVPALLALMPEFAMSPASAAVSSMETPNACATGAAYFIVSPSISTLVFVFVMATAYTSAMCPAASASKPNAVRSSDTISAVLARSVPPAAARFKSPGMPAMI